MRQFFVTHRRTLQTTLQLVLLAVFLNIVLIAIPGYFSHDEIEFGTRATRATLAEVPWASFTRIADFHYRPLTFNVWELASYYLFDVPQAMHAVLVALHVANGLLLYWLSTQLAEERRFSFAAFLVFAAFPTAAIAVGCVSTIADLLCLWFLLCALVVFCTRNEWAPASSRIRALAYGIFAVICVMGLMCKEQFIVIAPCLLVLSLLFRERRAVDLVAISGGISVTYLTLRWSALASRPTASYTMSFANLPKNLFVYVTYPFTWSVHEAHTMASLASSIEIALALVAHAGVLLLIYRSLGLWFAMAYVALYGIAIGPVVLIGGVFGHYLYTVTPLFALAFAWLLTRPQSRAALAAAACFALPAAVHTATIDHAYFRIGVVQTRIFTSLYSIAKTLGQDSGILHGRAVVVVSDGNDRSTLLRALHDLVSLRELTFRSDQFTVVGSGERIPAGALVLRASGSGYVTLPAYCSWGYGNACSSHPLSR